MIDKNMSIYYDWNIECNNAEELNNVIAYVNSIHQDIFIEIKNAWNNGIRFVRFNMNTKVHNNFSVYRTINYPKSKSISYDEFLSIITDVKKTNNKIFPKQWSIKCNNNNRQVFHKFVWHTKINPKEFYGATYKWYNFDGIEISRSNSDNPEYDIVTIEEIENEYLKKKIEEKIIEPIKKIIGYLAPYDLYNGKIKTGQLYKLSCPENGYMPSIPGGANYNVAAEIVEKDWIPYYEEEKNYIDNIRKIHEIIFLDKDTIKIDHVKYSKNDLKSLYHMLCFGQMKHVTFGENEYYINSDFLLKIINKLDKMTIC